MKIEEHGLWWRCVETGKRDFLIYAEPSMRGDGFTREQAEIIGPQVFERSDESHYWNKHQHVEVDCYGEKFYVHVDNDGSVALPLLVGGKYGKTLNTGDIENFTLREPWLSLR